MKDIIKTLNTSLLEMKLLRVVRWLGIKAMDSESRRVYSVLSLSFESYREYSDLRKVEIVKTLNQKLNFLQFKCYSRELET